MHYTLPVMYFISAWLSCVVDPSWSFNLRTLYSASDPYQPPGFTTPQ